MVVLALLTTSIVAPDLLDVAMWASVLVVGVAGCWAAASSLVHGLPAAHRLAGGPRADPPLNLPVELEQLRNVVIFAQSWESDFHMRLRPLLRAAAAYRVSVNHGIELDDQTSGARDLLGPAAWKLVRSDRPEPADHHAPGIGLDELRRVVDAIEAL